MKRNFGNKCWPLLVAFAWFAAFGMPEGFVSVAEILPDAILEIRYSSTYNFVGDRIDGYEEPCAIICHGFAGFTRWDDVAHDLCRAGIVVIIPHHRGAWGSEGDYLVTGCIRDAEELAKWASSAAFVHQYGTDASAVYLIGHSMGGRVRPTIRDGCERRLSHRAFDGRQQRR